MTALPAEVIRICKAGDIAIVQNVAPRYSSATLGSVGRMQDLSARQVRTMRADLEGRYGVEVTPASPCWPWLVRHSGCLLDRYHQRANGNTAHPDCFGVEHRGDVLSSARQGC